MPRSAWSFGARQPASVATPRRHRQLQPEHGSALRGRRPAVRRPGAGRGSQRPLQPLTGYSLSAYRRLLVAPPPEATFDRADQGRGRGRDGSIVLKMNSSVDTETIDALYEAPGGSARRPARPRDLLPSTGVPGFSETHPCPVDRRSVPRAFADLPVRDRERGFHHFIGSADLMPRNLERRVEVMLRARRPRTAGSTRSSKRDGRTTASRGSSARRASWDEGADGARRAPRSGRQIAVDQGAEPIDPPVRVATGRSSSGSAILGQEGLEED